jgi:hypothetical protein
MKKNVLAEELRSKILRYLNCTCSHARYPTEEEREQASSEVMEQSDDIIIRWWVTPSDEQLAAAIEEAESVDDFLDLCGYP